MLVHRWESAGARCGLLALLVLVCSLAVPEEVFARVGGGRSYSRPGSSSSSGSSSYSRSRHRDYGSSSSSDDEEEYEYEAPPDLELGHEAGKDAAREDHEAGLPFDVSRHTEPFGDPERFDPASFEKGLVEGYRKEARALIRLQGREAAFEDWEAGLEFDPRRHATVVSDRPEKFQQEFRRGYFASFQNTARQNEECIEAYLLPEANAEDARLMGETYASNLVDEHRDLDASYWEDKPLCEGAVITPEQSKPFEQGFSSQLDEEIARRQREKERDLAAQRAETRERIIWGGVLGALALAAQIFWLVRKRRRRRRVQSTTHRPASPAKTAASQKRRRISLSEILSADPNFSLILFEDCAVRLYAQLHREAAPGRDIESMLCYATAAVRKKLREFHAADATVPIVLVGSLQIDGVESVVTSKGSEFQIILCEVESNITTGAPGSERTVYLRQKVDFGRRLGVQTRPPDGVTTFGCPICRAPFASRDAIRCDHCGNEATDGRAAWGVNRVETLEQVETAPALTSDHPERGNQLPTVVDPWVVQGWQSLSTEDPSITEQSIAARLNVIYHGLNAGWMSLDERQLRPHVSDGLFDYFCYWLAAYRSQGLRNQLESMRLTGWEVAKVTRDAFYDAVTVRIYATGLDYTVRADTGAVVSGSTSTPRPYTEYWTLIRGRGVRGEPRGTFVCPHCGGPLSINMGGTCDYCRVHVTSGEFDWVLSKIEQDESYGGGLDVASSVGATRTQCDRG